MFSGEAPLGSLPPSAPKKKKLAQGWHSTAIVDDLVVLAHAFQLHPVLLYLFPKIAPKDGWALENNKYGKIASFGDTEPEKGIGKRSAMVF